MAIKKVVQDIVPSNRRSVRSTSSKAIQKNDIEDEIIHIKKNKEIEEEETVPKRSSRNKSNISKNNIQSRKSNKSIITFVAVLICITIIGIALSLIYTKAIITITPVNLNLNIDGNFTVKKDSASPDQLKYEVINMSNEVHKTINAADGPLIETKAKGIVTLFNNSSTTQKIIAGTKLSNNAGLIYKTTTTVIIPAKKTSIGSVSVGILAEKAGINYNSKLLDLNGDFKIVEYKNTIKNSLYYGRLKTDIVGGFSGKKKIISAELQKTTEAELQNELKAKLIAQIEPIIPKDFVLFDNAYTFDFKTLDPSSSATGTANIVVQGTINGLIFNKNILLKTIASKELKAFPTTDYNIKGFDNLEFTLNNIKDFSISKSNPLIFSLKGPITLTGKLSETELKDDLKGNKLSNSNDIFKKYGSISNAYARITPFWMRSFPNSIDSIIIEYKYK